MPDSGQQPRLGAVDGVGLADGQAKRGGVSLVLRDFEMCFIEFAMRLLFACPRHDQAGFRPRQDTADLFGKLGEPKGFSDDGAMQPACLVGAKMGVAGDVDNLQVRADRFRAARQGEAVQLPRHLDVRQQQDQRGAVLDDLDRLVAVRGTADLIADIGEER